jgi:hypothetical protein
MRCLDQSQLFSTSGVRLSSRESTLRAAYAARREMQFIRLSTGSVKGETIRKNAFSGTIPRDGCAGDS